KRKNNNAVREQRKKLRDQEQLEMVQLEERAMNFSPPSTAVGDGSTFIFDTLPISKLTAEGLKRAKFQELTEIQRKAIPMGLRRRDILGAAMTGSGKTLAFLVPMLEILYRERWSREDGIGAMIIAPTRELAVQIFNVLTKVGRNHSFSAGLIIGGKNLKEEQKRIVGLNIIICTPGRLLQHMNETPNFDCDNLKVLILDEADRILDMGFKSTLNAIIENLPRDRHTWLFSATQTKSVKDLARLSLRDPEYVAVHDKSETSTPTKLSQHYLLCELHQKIDFLFSFLKAHPNTKILVFMSTCKQVRYLYEAFTRLEPGFRLLQLHGRQNQFRRVEIFEKFLATKHAIMLATDVAARGLDFPEVNWVIQMDCPEDVATYIHRVGRTARYESEGNGLLLLLPSEETSMVTKLREKRVPIESIKVKENRTLATKQKLQFLCFQEPEIKYLAQKAFVTYMKSIHLQKDKEVFDVHAMPADEFAESLGLSGAPKITMIKKSKSKNQNQLPAVLSDSEQEDEDVEEGEKQDTDKPDRPKNKADRMFNRKNTTVLADHYAKLVDRSDHLDGPVSDNEDEDIFVVKRVIPVEEGVDSLIEEYQPAPKQGRRQQARQRKKQQKVVHNDKVLFDDEGQQLHGYGLKSEAEVAQEEGPLAAKIAERMQRERAGVAEHDALDKQEAKQRRQAKRLKIRQREREAM
ncbi:P-loop containing nucleoside triphosphate hydrolase protein, partial [Dimargaris cristalligena]